MELKCVLLDTSFLIRLLNENDRLHENALQYYRFFLEKGVILKVSTISIAEYCVKGTLDELPLRDVQILPFNIVHATKAGDMARTVYQHRDKTVLPQRLIIPNDTKLFAQADVESNIQKFVTSDQQCQNIFKLIELKSKVNFDILNIETPYHEAFGLLNL
ncbi:MAG: hypothetical protein RL757_1997 [Bacteroidota bacterium]|jgi:predicted nucleic acid-binding protein